MVGSAPVRIVMSMPMGMGIGNGNRCERAQDENCRLHFGVVPLGKDCLLLSAGNSSNGKDCRFVGVAL